MHEPHNDGRVDWYVGVDASGPCLDVCFVPNTDRAFDVAERERGFEPENRLIAVRPDETRRFATELGAIGHVVSYLPSFARHFGPHPDRF